MQAMASKGSKKKDLEGIPILKYGPGNNFAKFKEAISKVVIKKYGDLGKLIRQGTYYIPPAPAIWPHMVRWTQQLTSMG
jgi:hypothetical protein